MNDRLFKALDTNPDADLDADQFQLLGGFYQNDLPLDVDFDSAGVRITPPKSTWASMTAMTVAISSVYAGFVYIAIRVDAGKAFGPLIWVFIALIGLVAIVGPLVGHQWRLAYLRKRSPLIEFDRAQDQVRLHAGQFTFDRSDVRCLLGLCRRDDSGETKCELQLIVRHGEGLQPHLICCSLAGYVRKIYGPIMSRFAAESGIDAIIAEPLGLLGRGEMTISRLDEPAKHA